jgi:hypothetical protein
MWGKLIYKRWWETAAAVIDVLPKDNNLSIKEVNSNRETTIHMKNPIEWKLQCYFNSMTN